MTNPTPYEATGTQSRLIDGVKTKTLRLIADERGWLMEVLRSDDPEFFQKFGPGLCLGHVSRGRQGLALSQAPDR